jgi:hypothetical protein
MRTQNTIRLTSPGSLLRCGYAIFTTAIWLSTGAGHCAATETVDLSDRLVLLSDTSVYGPDHEPFTGILKLVPIRSKSTKPIFIEVTSGHLEQLVPPNDSESIYMALYLSDDRLVAYETWSIPTASYSITLDSVRRMGVYPPRGRPSPTQLLGNTTLSGTTTPSGTTITEDMVTGLIADLGVRAIKGPGYAPSRAAAVDPAGFLVSVAGSPSDCVHVDGTSGPCASTDNPPDLAGDASGTTSSVTVNAIQHTPVSPTLPTDGQVLTFNATKGMYVPTSSSNSNVIVALDTGAVLQQFTAMVTIPSLANLSCSPSQTVSLPGVTTGAPLLVNWPLPNGLIGQMRASSNNQAIVIVCNLSGTMQSPQSVTVSGVAFL